jgi:hypothetical protein
LFNFENYIIISSNIIMEEEKIFDFYNAIKYIVEVCNRNIAIILVPILFFALLIIFGILYTFGNQLTEIRGRLDDRQYGHNRRRRRVYDYDSF